MDKEPPSTTQLKSGAVMNLFPSDILLQENFENVGFSLIKSMVMMIGEFEFDDLFFDNVGNAPNELPLPYQTTTFLFFVVFVCVMSIIVMNLLVSIEGVC